MRLLTCLALSAGFCVANSLPAAAQREIHEVLSKGRVWTLTVNDASAPLALRGGAGGRTPDGGFELRFDVAWGELPGRLEAFSDAANSVRSMALSLTTADGNSLECDGFIARGTDVLLAGTCGDGTDGVWFAVPVEDELQSGSDATVVALQSRMEVQAARIIELSNRRDVLLEQLREARRASRDATTLLDRCQERCAASAESNGDPPPVSSFLHELTGRLGGGKADNVQDLAFPAAPASGSELATWLAALDRGLLSSLRGLYNAADIGQFLAAEARACQSGGVFCSMAFRQQGLEFALGSNGGGS